MPKLETKLCPCCLRTLSRHVWRLDGVISGEERSCPDVASCGYRSTWTYDRKFQAIKVVTHMKMIQPPKAPPANMVPGGSA